MRTATVAFLLALAGLIVLADLGRLPEWAYAVYRLPLGDKVAHVGLATVGAFLAGRWRVRAPLVLGLALTLEELSQRWFPTRVPDAFDLLSTWAGIALGAALSRWPRRGRPEGQ